MSVFDGIREARDSLVNYLALIGGNSSSSERKDESSKWIQEMSEASRILSEIPETAWSKQIPTSLEVETAPIVHKSNATENNTDSNEDQMNVECQYKQQAVDSQIVSLQPIIVNNVSSLSTGPIITSNPPISDVSSAETADRSTEVAERNSGIPPERSASVSSNLSSTSNDRLLHAGFAEVGKLLQEQNPGRGLSGKIKPFMSLGDQGMNEGWATIHTNAAYCYENTPSLGWRREVAIRMGGKSKGNTDIHYVTPDKRRRFRSRQELSAYLMRTSNNSMSFLNTFEFRAAFCLCHEPEDHSRSYVECSFGLGGCNRWLHAECLGLGSRSEQELALMPKVICPYCVAYLTGTGELESFVTPDMYVMKNLPEAPEEQDEDIDDAIEESAEPHLLWGLQGSPFVYCSASNASGLDAPPPSDDEYEEVVGGSSEPVPLSGQDLASADIDSIIQNHLLREPSLVRRTAPMASEVMSDADDGVPSNTQDLEPGERVRRARHEDGSTTIVRVDGGWMPKRRLDVVDVPITLASEQQQLVSDPDDAKRRKGAVRKVASPVASAPTQRHKNDLVEAAASTAKSSSHRPKRSFEMKRLASALAASVEPVPHHVLAELRSAFHSQPYLPIGGGGLQFDTVLNTNVPNSLHALCMANLMCGVCLTSTDDDLIPIEDGAYAFVPSDTVGGVDSGKGKARKSRKYHNDSRAQFVDPEVDRFNLVSVSCGAVTFSAHKQCAHGKESGLCCFDDSSATESGIVLGAAYEYEHVDDADCDLCGRKGGFLQYFHIAEQSSSTPPPAEEGWLAHIPCVNFLHHSGLLKPLAVRTTARVVRAAHADRTIGPGQYEASNDEESSRTALQEAEDFTHGRTPLSRFDMLHGQWRCVLCGLQCGVALRCAATDCSTRVHPLCVQACGNRDWQICSVSAESEHGEQRALAVLCSLHSAPLQQ